MMGVTKHACQFSLRACAVVTATVKKINKIFHGDWCNQRQQHRESSGWWEKRTSLAWSNRWCRRSNATEPARWIDLAAVSAVRSH